MDVLLSLPRAGRGFTAFAVGKVLLAAVAFVAASGLWTIVQFVYRQLTSPLRHLRGPKATSLIFGSLRDNPDGPPFEEWVRQYGPTLKYRGFFNSAILLTVDLQAINHVLTHSNDYQKPTGVRFTLAKLTGEGVLVIEGAKHRQQRHVMNPAFGPAQIRALTDIFLEKAIRLRDVCSSEIDKNPAVSITGVQLNILPWLGRMTLDVIGLAGFGCEFDALNANEKRNELNVALETVIGAGENVRLLPVLQASFPPLRIIPSARGGRIKVARRTMGRIGRELLAEAKASALAAATDKGEIEKNSFRGRDLLSLLVKANMATDLPEDQRMSDEDVLAQVPTFLVAGHETTSTATAWALFALAKAPQVQMKLREELLSIDTDTPSMDELMALPYLDAVVRETLRVHSPVPNTGRVAMKDDVLPVEKPYKDENGVVQDSIRISKGDSITIPIQTINLSPELWGPDSHEFKPERWENIPEAVSHIPGVWGHLLSFLGGPRACIGFRFSLVELKALLFTLIRAFEFELAVPASEIQGKASVAISWPVLRSDPESKPQLPMWIKTYKQM